MWVGVVRIGHNLEGRYANHGRFGYRISPDDARDNQLHPRSNGVKFRPPVHE